MTPLVHCRAVRAFTWLGRAVAIGERLRLHPEDFARWSASGRVVALDDLPAPPARWVRATSVVSQDDAVVLKALAAFKMKKRWITPRGQFGGLFVVHRTDVERLVGMQLAELPAQLQQAAAT